MPAQTPDLPLVIEPETLQEYLDHPQLLIVDLSQAQVYQRAHVPGAVHLPFSRLTCGQKPAPGKLPSEAEIQQLFQEIGLTEDHHVVAYDDEGGGWAGRLIWTLDMIGHAQYSYLNGGIHAWLAAKLPVQHESVKTTPSQIQISLKSDGPSVEKEYILSRIGSDDFIIWDARTPEEYSGTRAFAQKAGHIPGAAHYEWTDAMDRARQLRIRDLGTIKSELAERGITADKEIITHCQTHHRSGFTYLLGKVLGFENIKAYPGSWSEWGNDPDTPVET